MSYIKINGDVTHYKASYTPFTTQHGYEAVRFIGEEIPDTSKGFKVYDEDGNEILDLSRYKFMYRPNEFSVKYDRIEQPQGNNEVRTFSGSSMEKFYKVVKDLSSEIDNLTPYTETKTAYIDDTNIIFDTDIPGNILVSAIDSDGNSVDNLVSREDHKIIVEFFKPLELVTKVTISIQ